MKYLISFLFLALAFSMKSEAKVTLPSILGDNMVLQQQAEVKLWGKARPNATVTVKTSWNGQTYKSSSDGKGGWSLTVSTPVAGGPYKITFNDGELLTLQNVLIGEVWFCSGQSNMEFYLNWSATAAQDVPQAANSNIRLYDMKARWRTDAVEWDACRIV